MMLPGEVTMIPVYLLWNKIGQLHRSTTRVLPHIGVGTQYPLWVPNIFGSAFYIFLQRQFFLGIPRDYFEAARMDGDSYFSMFWRIALPLAKPALIVTFIFEVQAKWFDLITPLIYLRDQALFTAPLGMKILLDRFNNVGGGEGDYQVIMAGTLLLVLPMVILFAAFQQYFIRGHRDAGPEGVAAGVGGCTAAVGGGTDPPRPADPRPRHRRDEARGGRRRRAPARVHGRSSSRRRTAQRGPRRRLERLFELGAARSPRRASTWADIARGRDRLRRPARRRARGPDRAAAPARLGATCRVDELAERALGRPAVLENDATAAAAGEHRYGAGGGARDMVYLTHLDRRRRRRRPRRPALPRRERERRRARPRDRRLARPRVPRLRPARLPRGVRLGHVDRRARSRGGARTCGDRRATSPPPPARATPSRDAVWDETIEALACGVTSIVNLFEPELVVLGGGVSRAGEQLLAPVRERVQARGDRPAAGARVALVRAALGDAVGVVGAGGRRRHERTERRIEHASLG